MIVEAGTSSSLRKAVASGTMSVNLEADPVGSPLSTHFP